MRPLRFQPAATPETEIDRLIAGARRASLRALVGDGPVFVLAPHPDDESLGCGGLIAACAAARVPVFVHFLTDGRNSHPGSLEWPPERIAAEREREARGAAALLGLSESALIFERAVDGTLLFDWPVAQALAARVTERASPWPSPVILAPWRGDPHPDHMAAAVIADMVEEKLRGARGLRFFVWTHDHAANGVPEDSSLVRFPMGRWRERKRAAIYAHRTQVLDVIADLPAERRVVPQIDRVLARDELYLCAQQARARFRGWRALQPRNVSP